MREKQKKATIAKKDWQSGYLVVKKMSLSLIMMIKGTEIVYLDGALVQLHNCQPRSSRDDRGGKTKVHSVSPSKDANLIKFPNLHI